MTLIRYLNNDISFHGSPHRYAEVGIRAGRLSVDKNGLNRGSDRGKDRASLGQLGPSCPRTLPSANRATRKEKGWSFDHKRTRTRYAMEQPAGDYG
jgi:hypothetical protein